MDAIETKLYIQECDKQLMELRQNIHHIEELKARGVSAPNLDVALTSWKRQVENIERYRGQAIGDGAIMFSVPEGK